MDEPNLLTAFFALHPYRPGVSEEDRYGKMLVDLASHLYQYRDTYEGLRSHFLEYANAEEPVTEADTGTCACARRRRFLRCDECLHIFLTADDFVDADNAVRARLGMEPNDGNPDHVLACPECSGVPTHR